MREKNPVVYLHIHSFEQCSYAKQTSPIALISLLVIPKESGQSYFNGYSLRYSHVPPWCRCRSWCFPEAAQHAAWTGSCLCPGSVWSAPHSCCTEAIFVTFLQSCTYKSPALFPAHTLPLWSGPRCFQGCCVFWCDRRRWPRPVEPEALWAGSLHFACTHYCPH